MSCIFLKLYWCHSFHPLLSLLISLSFLPISSLTQFICLYLCITYGHIYTRKIHLFFIPWHPTDRVPQLLNFKLLSKIPVQWYVCSFLLYIILMKLHQPTWKGNQQMVIQFITSIKDNKSFDRCFIVSVLCEQPLYVMYTELRQGERWFRDVSHSTNQYLQYGG